MKNLVLNVKVFSMEKVLEFIEEKSLIQKNDQIIVGVSGGADSVYLLRVLCFLRDSLNLTLEAVHVNHQIRNEAGNDQQFVEKLCEKLSVPCTVICADVKKIAREQKLTLEEAGRKVRYDIFYERQKLLGNAKIAVAHHKNDQAETFLFRAARGTGLEGAGAMKAADFPLIRPLLCMQKHEIQEKLLAMNQEWVEDVTNIDNAYARNHIRNQIIPLLEEVNEQAVEHIAFLTEDIQEAAKYLRDIVWKEYQNIVENSNGQKRINCRQFQKRPLWMQKQVIKKALEETAGCRKDIEKRHVMDLLDLVKKETGKQISLPYEMTAEKSYQYIYLRKGKKQEKQQMEGILLKEEIQDFSNILENDCIKIIDYDKIEKSIQLRHRRPGDFFVFGSDGKKKSLNRYFIDEKFPRNLRDKIFLVADGSHIVWIVGYRVSSHYKVSGTTKRYLKLEFQRERGEE